MYQFTEANSVKLSEECASTLEGTRIQESKEAIKHPIQLVATAKNRRLIRVSRSACEKCQQAEKMTNEEIDSPKQQYTYELFKYVTYLNQLSETRANYLILANSVVNYGILSVSQNIDRWFSVDSIVKVATFTVLIIMFMSIVCCVWAIMPRTFDKTIEINHGVIGKLDRDTYYKVLSVLTSDDMLKHFAYEINVLCKIVNRRLFCVKLATVLFFIGISIAFLVASYLMFNHYVGSKVLTS